MIREAQALFDELIVAIGSNPDKKATYTVAERRRMLEDITASFPNVRIDSFESRFLVDYAHSVKAGYIVRGIRSVADYEYEHQLSGMNHHLLPQAETVFLITADRYSFVSSSLIRETARLGGDVGALVHPGVKKNLTAKVCTQS